MDLINCLQIREGKDLETKFNLKTNIIMKTKTSIYHRSFAYILLVAIIFCGCETTINKKDTGLKYMGRPIEIMTIDSCEYVFVSNGPASWGSHKGNCKWCKLRQDGF